MISSEVDKKKAKADSGWLWQVCLDRPVSV